MKQGLIVFFILVLSVCRVFATEADNQKIADAINLYDRGKFDAALGEFKSVSFQNGPDEIIAWLNIAIIEYEKNDKTRANEALRKAETLVKNQTHKRYVHVVESIFKEKRTDVDFTLIKDFKAATKLLTRFFLWQVLCYKLMNADDINLVECENAAKILMPGIKPNTIRWAKLSGLEAVFQYKRNRYNEMAHSLLTANTLLEKLGQGQSRIFYRNVWRIFYYLYPKQANPFRKQILDYEERFAKTTDKEIEAALYFFKSRYSSFNQDYVQDLFYMKKAYQLFPDDPNFIIRLAYSYQKMNDYRAALTYFKKLKPYDNFKLEGYLGVSYCSKMIGDTIAFRKYCLAFIQDKQFEKISLNLYVRFIQFLKGYSQYDLFSKINPAVLKRLNETFEKNTHLSNIYLSWAGYWWFKGDYEKALEHYHKSIIAVLPHEYNEDVNADLNLRGAISLPNLIEGLYAKAEAFFALARRDNDDKNKILYYRQGLKNLHLAIEQLYNHKTQLPGEEQMLVFTSLRSNYFPRIIEVCLRLHELTGDNYYQQLVFKYTEQGRATVMLSMLRSKYGQRVGMIPEKYKLLEDSLNMRISILTQKLKTGDGDNYNLNTQLDILAAKRTDLEQLYKKHYPNYYNLKYSMEVVNPTAFQKTLKNDECIIEYQLNRSLLIAFYFDNRNLKIVVDSLRNVDLARLADRFYGRVNKFNSLNYTPDSIHKFAQDSYELYKILLKPFESYLKGKRLTIIADNSLRKIPFEALIVKMPDQIGSYKDLPYLLKTTPVYYAPSITFLNELRLRPIFQNRARLLAVAPVYSNLKLNDTISRTLLAVRSDTSIFGSLPNAKKEIEFANSIAGGMLLIEKRATETRFKRLSGKFDIIHLATHGILNRDSSLQSKLLFAESQPRDDGFLHNYEIYNLNQQSQLVILSACNTGAGKNYGGEEVISTGRAFLSSGSRSVIMTLWPVNDHASYELIKGFYEGLKEEQQICEALRQSKLKYIENADKMHSHPFFWTGYVIYGDASIKLPIGNDRLFYFTLLGLLIFVPVIWRLFQKIRNNCRPPLKVTKD